MKNKNVTPRFCDEVMVALQNPKRITGYTRNHVHEKTHRNVMTGVETIQRFKDKGFMSRQEKSRRLWIERMNSATKFQVDDSLLNYIANKSLSLSPKEMYNNIKDSIPSSEMMWIEWNEKSKTIADENALQRKLGYVKSHDLMNNTKSERVGYLLEYNKMEYDRHKTEQFPNFTTGDESTSRWVTFSPFMIDQNNKLVIFPFGFLIALTHPMNYNHEETIMTLKQTGYRDSHIEKYKRTPVDQLSEEYRSGQVELMGSLLGHDYWIQFHREFGVQDKSYFTQVAENRYVDLENSNIFSSAFVHWFRKIAGHCQITNHTMSPLIYTSEDMEEFQSNKLEEEKVFGRRFTQMLGDGRFLLTLLSTLNYDHHVNQKVMSKNILSNYAKWNIRVPKNEYKLLSIDLPKDKGINVYDRTGVGSGTEKRKHFRRGHFRNCRGHRKWIEGRWVGNEKLGTIYHDYNLEKAS